MKIYIKNGVRVLYDYIVALIFFMIFIYPFMVLTKDSFNSLLTWYSLLFFLFAFFLIYAEMKEAGIKEKNPHYEYSHYPLKGLVYGLIGVIPIALVTGIFTFIHFSSDIAERIKHVGINAFLGPLYFMIRWMKEAVPAYFAAILVIPVIAALGYLAGYFGIDITGKIFKKQPQEQQKGFTKSPWNPTLNQDNVKKKKSSKTGGQ